MGDPLETSMPNLGRVSRARACAQVTVHRLRPREREAVRAHLRALDAQDRYLRFGYPATDAHIDRYVDALDFRRDELYAVTGADCRRRKQQGEQHRQALHDRQHAGDTRHGGGCRSSRMCVAPVMSQSPSCLASVTRPL